MTTKPSSNSIALAPEPKRRRLRSTTHSIVRVLRRDVTIDHYALLRAARY